MRLRVRVGRRVFAPSMALTVFLLLLAVVFLALGRWQWRMGNAREVQFRHFQLGADRVLPVTAGALSHVPQYQRVRLAGRYDAAHQFLLDNSIHDGRDGYQVLTPFRWSGGTVLIDRGWVPFGGDRARLPDVAFDAAGIAAVTGRIGPLPTPGLSFGRMPPPLTGPWPRVTTFPSTAQLAAAFGEPLDARILLLDPGEPQGYLRDWSLPGMPALKNWGYAIQWWAFAAAALVIWIVLGFRRL